MAQQVDCNVSHPAQVNRASELWILVENGANNSVFIGFTSDPNTSQQGFQRNLVLPEGSYLRVLIQEFP